MRTGISITVGSSDRLRLEGMVRERNAAQKHVWRAAIILLCADGVGTHEIMRRKHPKVRAWLDRHKRFVLHFTPTSCSWLNAVEGFFAKLAKRRLNRGVFHSLVDLQAAINRFVAETNENPKSFSWTADPDRIIAAVKRRHQALDSIH